MEHHRTDRDQKQYQRNTHRLFILAFNGAGFESTSSA